MTATERSCAVWLHEQRVGTLHARDSYTRFVLDRAYVDDPNRAVLGLRFEEDLLATHRSNMRLPPWFSNLLPEGQLRKLVAVARGVPDVREIELLVQLGDDLPGAVRVTEDTEPKSPPRGSRELVTPDPSLRSTTPVWRFSLAGVAMKFSVLRRDDRFTAPAVGVDGDYILKLPDPTYPGVPLNEQVMMEWARRSGLVVPETQLVDRDQIDGIPNHVWKSGERQAYAVRRFDRQADGSRVHMEDLAQVRGFYPDQKYDGSFETIAAHIYRGHDIASLTEFCKRVAFNILIHNGDAHLKNWSLLYVDPRVPTLSPAYDLVATDVYRPANDAEDLGLEFGGSRRFDRVSLAHFARLQQKLQADGPDLAIEVRDFALRASDAWPEVEPLLAQHGFIAERIAKRLRQRLATLLRG